VRLADYEGFIAALCDAGLEVPANLHAPTGASLADRFAVYRNNVHVSLVDCLAESYPVVRAQVGEDFFRAMARAFVQEHKPVAPLLTQYGEGFADFIAAFAPAAELPWLPDIARLEHTWRECWAAPDARALNLSTLRHAGPDVLARSRLRRHPAARLLRSAWPVATLWEAHQQAQPELSSLEWRRESVLVSRPHAEVLLTRLDEDAADFTAALLDGNTIEAASAIAPRLDPGAVLGQLLAAGSFQESDP